MKVSVSLPADDVAFLDSYARDKGIRSRSAVLHRAVALLRSSELAEAYESAWTDWRDSGAEADWGVTLADGLTDAPR
ncbi:MAG: ribbon-helix-helix protein, CopG family [Actinobacteria bacterium]|nr:ribbon-helix-helix protein, CopG family [Actinomycetota bacterium]